MANTSQRYYALRNRFNALLAAGQAESSEAAGIFYYLNRTGYNGLCRFNSSGEFNVPFGRYKNLVYRRHFPEYLGGFAHLQFMSGDFEALPIAPDDFIYADPPYDVDFRQYRERRIRLGPAGPRGGMAGEAPGPGGSVEPGHGSHHRAIRQTGV